jgi:outer membrane protein insertion porin family
MNLFGHRNVWAACCILVPVAAAQPLIVETKVLGAERLEPRAIAAAAGLNDGQPFTKSDLDEAARRLSATGMFTSVTYRCDDAGPEKLGCLLTWRIKEAPALLPVHLDIPGIDEREFWKEIGSATLMRDRIPGSDAASAYCVHIVEEFLRKRSRTEPIVAKMWADIDTRAVALLFRVASPTKVTAVRFAGNRSIGNGTLQAIAGRLVVGHEFSEYDIRNMLELNIRPLYDEKAHLTMKVLKVGMEESSQGLGTVIASVAIDEGPEWKLGTVQFVGEDLPIDEMNKAAKFPSGRVANWKQVLACIQRSELVLRRGGYSRVRFTPVRSYRNDSGIVDLEIKVDKGRPSRPS